LKRKRKAINQDKRIHERSHVYDDVVQLKSKLISGYIMKV